MVRLALVACLALQLAGCRAPTSEASDASPTLASRRMSIVSGQPDVGHPAVGFLTVSGKVHCTATLIARDRVLAAAHCLQVPALDFVLGATRRGVTRFWPHPSYDPSAAGHLPETFDLGVLFLDEPIDTVAPLALALGPPRVGERLTIVGFGRSADGAQDEGVKRKAETVVTRVLGHTYWLGQGSGHPPTVCQGDSGGPSLVLRDGVEQVLGVHSATEGEPFACRGIGFDVRVDVFTAWIDHPERAPRDLASGEPCSDDASCASGRCAMAPHFVCTEPCATAGAADCAGGERCVELALGGGRRERSCLALTAGARALGQRCDAAGQCVDGMVCLALAVGEGRCRAFCESAASGGCASLQTCSDDIFGFASVCVPGAGWSPSPAALGVPCAQDAECSSSRCAALTTAAAAQVCTQDCTPAASGAGGCPAGFVCAPSADGDGRCAPPPAAPWGAPCSHDAECQGGLCREGAGSMICTQPCGTALTQRCPDDASCSGLGARRVCLPVGGGCSVEAARRSDARAPLAALSALLLLLLGARRRRDR